MDDGQFISVKNIARARLRITLPADLKRHEQVRVPISGIWGRHDVYAIPDLEGNERHKSIYEGADCRVIDNAGYWVMYSHQSPLIKQLWNN